MLLIRLKSRIARGGKFLLLLSGCCGPPLRRPRVRHWLLAALLCGPPQAPATPSLTSDSTRPTAGYYQLNWSGASTTSFQLQESRQADFAGAVTLYQGPDRATVLTGRPDGDYYYRLRILDTDGAGPWSDPLEVQVRHHPLARALLFFALGALVFLATLVAILAGNRRLGDGS